ncbi:nucleotidyltransferase domain-containing protein [Candidatus Woesearchaeota archaeon]|nr:nucleotidyltransferase domain-containing protein [Candidatus Woesearchaeota archaeon]
MELYKLKFTTLQLEIFRMLCIKTAKKLNQRELAHFLDVSPTAIAKSLLLLKKEGLILLTKGKTNLNTVELNRNSKKTVELKRAENFKLFVESGIIDYLEDTYPGAAIVLFGSYSRGDDIYSSDIDLAVMGSKEKKIDLLKYEKLLEKEIRINYYNHLNEINKHLKSNICNGIVLSGGFEL